ncbi:1-phosphofructokinase [Geodermatophilus sp. SYSU D00708]
MILTVTPNPSVDRTVFLDGIRRGAVLRSSRSRSEPSGKGVNVALALQARGHDVVAVLPVGGAAGAQIADMLGAAGVPHVAVPITGEIRSNISLVEPDGTVTKVNEAGPLLDAADVESLTAAVLKEVDGVAWLALCGSLPAGVPPAYYATLTEEAHRRGVRTVVDSSGAALCAALDAGPDLVKPNAQELGEVAGRRLETLGDVVDAAEALRERGARSVLASLGPDGAVLVDREGARHGEAPVQRIRSAVGAGDALLAGFLAAGGEGPDALRSALAWGAAAVQQEGTVLSGDARPVEVTVHAAVRLDRRLAEPVPDARAGAP